MLISWDWLKQYVTLDMPPAELERRLMMAGFNHESTVPMGDDLAIDFEITSNRPDCLGHLGLAREVSVLWQRPLTIPAAKPVAGRARVEDLVSVRIECPDLCYRYTARVVRGIKAGPSPAWMVKRLATVGIAAINNVVDISNYVLMECGQPLHTFDYGRLKGPAIVVRRPRPGETIEAIDHKEYALDPQMCVIADARDAVAIGGVMGGAATEINARTVDVLVEAAEFDPLSIRSTSRQLRLHSDSSYRFERKIDSEQIDWASRRCCELILELAGGELATGVIDVGRPPVERKSITLRYAQLKRILGIDVDPPVVRTILTALGLKETGAAPASVTATAPSWRRDLTREIDLIEEVARIHGYEKIPEDVRVPMASSVRGREERVLGKVRQALTAAGYDEALTLSAVDEAAAASFSPWTDAPPLVSLTPVLRGADRLRRSLAPSLLAARKTNEALANPTIELFEIAKVYLARPDELPLEEPMLGLTSGCGYAEARGTIEALVAALNPGARLTAEAAAWETLDPTQSCRLSVDGHTLGYVGALSAQGQTTFDLRAPAVVAELRLEPLMRLANLTPRYEPLPNYPAVTRDLNLVVDEAVRWADLAATVELGAGEYYEGLEYRDVYRDAQRLGPGKKSLLMTLTLRWKQGTLTNQEADQLRDQIVVQCGAKHGAALRA